MTIADDTEQPRGAVKPGPEPLGKDSSPEKDFDLSLETSEIVQPQDAVAAVLDEPLSELPTAEFTDDGELEVDDDDEPVAVHEREPEDDPFASGVFDLEHGAPLEPVENRPEVLPWRSYIDNAKDFFNTEVLYRIDILGKKDRDQLNGKYRVELKGFRGGVWTISVGSDVSVVNRREEADVALSMQQQDFIQLINGELNPQLAIVAEKVKINGDVRRAILFQKVLAPSGHDREY